MSEPRANNRPSQRPAQEPQEPLAAPGRLDRTPDELALRCGELELLDPEALDLAAELYVAIHEQLAGRATSLRGQRKPKYFREQLRAVHPLTVEDIARLIRTEPDALVPFVRLLARAVRYGLQPLRREPVDVREANARVAETMGRVVATVERAMVDDEVTDCEKGDIDAQIAATERHLEGLCRPSWCRSLRLQGEVKTSALTPSMLHSVALSAMRCNGPSGVRWPSLLPIPHKTDHVGVQVVVSAFLATHQTDART